MTFPGRKSSPVPQTDSNVTLGQVNVDLLHHLSGLPDTPRASVASSDEVAINNLEPATKALKLMVCVSRNKECLGTLVSYLCLPKFMDKYVNVTHELFHSLAMCTLFSNNNRLFNYDVI